MENSSDAMVMRWYLRVQQYSSEIIHISGESNIVPDSGSRLFHLIHPVSTPTQFCSLFSTNLKSKSSIDIPALQSALLNYELDNVSEIYSNQITNDDWMHRTMHTPSIDPSAQTQSLNRGVLNTLPPDFSEQLDVESSNLRLRKWLQSDVQSASIPVNDSVHVTHSASSISSTQSGINDSHSVQQHYQHPNILIDSSSSINSARRPLPITTEHYNWIRSCHNAASGHFGRDETIRKLERNGMHWHTRFIDVARYIASCPQCQNLSQITNQF
jgi:hypothetical protein